MLFLPDLTAGPDQGHIATGAGKSSILNAILDGEYCLCLHISTSFLFCCRQRGSYKWHARFVFMLSVAHPLTSW